MSNATYELISRDAAHYQSLKRYYTGEPCSKGHYSQRYVSNGACVECLTYTQYQFRRSAYSKALKPYTCPTFWVSDGLAVEDRRDLAIYLQRCIVEFTKHKGLLTEELQEAFETHISKM